MAARRFLYIVAFLILLVIAAGIGWSLFQDRLLRAAFVPAVDFVPPPPAERGLDYADVGLWLSRPDRLDDPSRWLPTGAPDVKSATPVPIFYVSPTTYLAKDRWNAPIADGQALYRQRLFAMSQASAFTAAGPVWSPLYRQASVGAFFTTEANARLALDVAYQDVLRAFDAFLAANPARPIILAGHSQGSSHVTRLLAERAAGKPLASRIVAAYVIGWPISIAADLPALGLPGCAAPEQVGCIVAFQSFAEPAEPRQILAIYDETTGITGQPRRGTPMLCVNPLTGRMGDAAPASANLGALVPSADLTTAALAPGRIGANCDAGGLLLIGGDMDGYRRYVLPGNNYHVFDYALFWSNLRADAARRAAAFEAR